MRGLILLAVHARGIAPNDFKIGFGLISTPPFRTMHAKFRSKLKHSRKADVGSINYIHHDYTNREYEEGKVEVQVQGVIWGQHRQMYRLNTICKLCIRLRSEVPLPAKPSIVIWNCM
jgi:hypothetical protein